MMRMLIILLSIGCVANTGAMQIMSLPNNNTSNITIMPDNELTTISTALKHLQGQEHECKRIRELIVQCANDTVSIEKKINTLNTNLNELVTLQEKQEIYDEFEDLVTSYALAIATTPTVTMQTTSLSKQLAILSTMFKQFQEKKELYGELKDLIGRCEKGEHDLVSLSTALKQFRKETKEFSAFKLNITKCINTIIALQKTAPLYQELATISEQMRMLKTKKFRNGLFEIMVTRCAHNFLAIHHLNPSKQKNELMSWHNQDLFKHFITNHAQDIDALHKKLQQDHEDYTCFIEHKEYQGYRGYKGYRILGNLGIFTGLFNLGQSLRNQRFEWSSFFVGIGSVIVGLFSHIAMPTVVIKKRAREIEEYKKEHYEAACERESILLLIDKLKSKNYFKEDVQ